FLLVSALLLVETLVVDKSLSVSALAELPLLADRCSERRYLARGRGIELQFVQYRESGRRSVSCFRKRLTIQTGIYIIYRMTCGNGWRTSLAYFGFWFPSLELVNSLYIRGPQSIVNLCSL